MIIVMRNCCLATMIAAAATISMAGNAAALTAADRKVVARVEAYLNAIRTLTARFIQAEPNGWIAEGALYLQRPGKMRIEYAPPHRFLMVTTGRMLIVYNGKTDATMHLPVSASPAAFLLGDRVDFTREAEVRRVERRPNAYVISVSQRGGGRASLRLVFRRKPFGIKEWTVVDARQKKTRVVLLDPRIGHPIDPVKFLFAKPGRAAARRRGGRPPRVKATDLK
ncbi:MAG TPA: outer membrane lipoprotein carrier protein LolA [Alphaproteobacteria bacterium]|nr:outer membrane lipoprotein carrier protein LolA [Alphaproteobacteria bacterium]